MPPTTKYWLQISAFIAFVLLVIATYFPFISRVQIHVFPPKVPNAGLFHASKQNVWADLSREEAQDLTKFLFSASELNLTESSNATRSVTLSRNPGDSDEFTSNDNSVVLLELLQPNKTDVLAYLNGTSGPPERWARVVVNQGATEQAQYVIYAVCLPLHWRMPFFH